MSHFYGKLLGNRGEATRCGTQGSGMLTHCAGWQGAIRAEAFSHNNVDMYRVSLTPWQHSGGSSVLLSAGTLQAAEISDEEITITPWARELMDSWLPTVENLRTLDWMQRRIARAYTEIGGN